MKVSGRRPREPVCLCPPDPHCSRGPKKATPECFIRPLSRRPRTLGGNIFCSAQHGARPLLGRGYGPLWDRGMQLPLGDKWPPDCLFQHHLILRLPSWPLGASVPHSGNASPHLCPFPSPEIFSLCPLLLSYPPKSGRRAATASLLSA